MKLLRIAIGSLVVTLLAVSPVSAHTELVSSNPAEGTVLPAAPAEVVLTFTEPPLLEGSAIAVTSDNGASASPAPLTLVGSELHAPWPTDITSGNITIDWRAVADDGHVVTGAITFTIGQTTIPSPMAASADLGDSNTDSSPKTPWLGLGIVLVVGILLAGLLARKNK